jgi:hypothetical protein
MRDMSSQLEAHIKRATAVAVYAILTAQPCQYCKLHKVVHVLYIKNASIMSYKEETQSDQSGHLALRQCPRQESVL